MNKILSIPKRTAILILVLALLTLALLFVAYPKTQTYHPNNIVATPTIAPQKTILSFSPNPLIATSSSLTINVVVNTNSNNFIGAQLELGYDPKLVTINSITAGNFLINPVVLANKINNTTGKAFFAFTLPPTQTPLSGSGIIATVNFATKLLPNQQTNLNFLKSLTMTADTHIKGSSLLTANPAIIINKAQ